MQEPICTYRNRHRNTSGKVIVHSRRTGRREPAPDFRDFFKGDVPQAFPFDLKQFAKKGTSFKDWMCPDSMEFERDHFKIGDRYGRVLYMQDYASYVKDDMISELCDFSRNLMLSIDILPVPTDEAVREIQNRLLGVETNVTNWQRRQNANNNFSAIVPYDMELQRKETKEMLDDLTTRDQRMMFGILTMVHLADSKNSWIPIRNYYCR